MVNVRQAHLDAIVIELLFLPDLALLAMSPSPPSVLANPGQLSPTVLLAASKDHLSNFGSLVSVPSFFFLTKEALPDAKAQESLLFRRFSQLGLKAQGNSHSTKRLQNHFHCHTNQSLTLTRRRQRTTNQTTFHFRLDQLYIAQGKPFDLSLSLSLYTRSPSLGPHEKCLRRICVYD